MLFPDPDVILTCRITRNSECKELVSVQRKTLFFIFVVTVCVPLCGFEHEALSGMVDEYGFEQALKVKQPFSCCVE